MVWLSALLLFLELLEFLTSAVGVAIGLGLLLYCFAVQILELSGLLAIALLILPGLDLWLRQLESRS
jgi:hypothetical protein